MYNYNFDTEEEETTQLTEEEQSLLNTEFPEDIEKIAEAHITTQDAIAALQAFGEAKAEVELLTAAGDEDGVEMALEKQANASEVIEHSMKAIRAMNYSEESEMDAEELNETLTKEASVAGQLISDGYFAVYNWAAEEAPELVKEAKSAKAAGEAASKAGSAIMKRLKGAGGYVKGEGKKAVEQASALGKKRKAADQKKINAFMKKTPKSMNKADKAGIRSAEEGAALKGRIKDTAKGVGKMVGAGGVLAGTGYGGYRAMQD